ncbi:hypothetical protein SYNTR_2265 [Candidatus Syntrophocurvum alkaliphilum]|uniref:Uncharacterized protein n=1 Tax=Candidatus Syntrophocurvum alkaliphilum TaxID=2293317 RepID=A0A6I6DJW9_9FIRM|nr:hypothetical protein SYNTR_2265 [Candidatus Syntrophocurvum alkaliphilum]
MQVMLLSKIKAGDLTLQNRVVIAAMTLACRKIYLFWPSK